mmetsp:Transcript_18/g.39  ORF Transcript_18/g.39 Transcript_18/m.39 type:complete len:239 (+) Transcript_18:101-817(+)
MVLLGWVGAVTASGTPRRHVRCSDRRGVAVASACLVRDERALGLARKWVDEIIVPLALCPYAQPVRAAGTLRYAVSDAAAGDADTLIRDVLDECELLLDAESEDDGLPSEHNVETTVLVAPQWADAGHLDHFCEIGDELEAFIEEDELAAQIGVALFHPEWKFNNVSDDRDPVHFEQRAFLPTISLLRKSSIKRHVIAGLKRNSLISVQIREHNTRILNELGYERMDHLYANIRRSLS